jgi:GTPase SAR1 family protein
METKDSLRFQFDVRLLFEQQMVDARVRNVVYALLRQLISFRFRVCSAPFSQAQVHNGSPSRGLKESTCALYVMPIIASYTMSPQTQLDLNFALQSNIPVIKVAVQLDSKVNNISSALPRFHHQAFVEVHNIVGNEFNQQNLVALLYRFIPKTIHRRYEENNIELPEDFNNPWPFSAQDVAESSNPVGSTNTADNSATEVENLDETNKTFDDLALNIGVDDNINNLDDSSKVDQSTDDKYLKAALSKGKKAWGRSKIMIVGEGRAGKTALANSIIGKDFDDTASTIGINLVTCDVKYATVGGDKASWSEYSKPDKELEAALVEMILNEKAGRIPSHQPDAIVKSGQAAKSMFDDVDPLTVQVNTTIYQESDSASNQSSHIEEDTEIKSNFLTQAKLRTANLEPVSSVDSRLTPATEKPAQSSVTESISNQLSIATTKAKNNKPVDDELVMKCLANNIKTDSKFVLSIFDFGGQSVFNVIHPFFLTRYGVYLIVFNMQWFLDPDERIRMECISYLTFWVNSVVIHTLNDREETAPIIFVGTRGDLVVSPADHESISTFLYQTFRSSIAWPFVLENSRTQGVNGTIDMFFFPINNRLGRKDANLIKLLQVIEDRLDVSDYIHEERPLTWLKLLDQMTAQKEFCLTFADIVSLAEDCDVDPVSLPQVLHLFHEMGIVMWHEEDDLRDVIILNPIEYFVTPATVVICKHSPSLTDTIYHSLDIHKKCMKLHYHDWSVMINKGMLSNKLLEAFLQPSTSNAQQAVIVKKLMIKYGLLVPLLSSISISTKELSTEEQTSYLAPALLPESAVVDQDPLDDFWFDVLLGANTFFFVFTASKQLEQETTLTNDDLKTQGFLPSGLFERMICKAVSWSQQTSASVDSSAMFSMEVFELHKEQAILCFGNQRFRLTLHTAWNCMQVDVEGASPVAVHERLRNLLEKIIRECMKSLRVFTTVPFLATNETQTPLVTIAKSTNALLAFSKQMLHIRLSQVLLAGKQHSAFNLKSGGAGRRVLLSNADLMSRYGCWLENTKILSQYDIFLSYRWGAHDSYFTQSLFDRLTLYSVGDSHRAVSTFLDTYRLKEGRTFQSEFGKALSSSLMAVPIVSHDALRRMKDHNPQAEDNVLAEWILCLLCYQQGSTTTQVEPAKRTKPGARIRKVVPILFGTIQSDGCIGNFFSENIIDELPNIHPAATLALVHQIADAETVELLNSSSWRDITVKAIVAGLCKYMCLLPWEFGNDPLLMLSTCADRIVQNLIESIQEEMEIHQPIPSAAVSAPVASALVSAAAVLEKDITIGVDPKIDVHNKTEPSALSIKDIVARIKEELDIDKTNFAEVFEEAANYLSQDVQNHFLTLKSLKEKAYYLAEQIGIS